MNSLIVHKANIHDDLCSLFSALNSCTLLVKKNRARYIKSTLLQKTNVFCSVAAVYFRREMIGNEEAQNGIQMAFMIFWMRFVS